MTLHLVGYWRSDADPGLPDPHDLVDAGWDAAQRLQVQRYLDTGTYLRGFRGWSPCRMCGQRNGARELTDGVLVWPEGLAHYVEDHQVRLPAGVERHVLSCVARLEAAPVSMDWWMAGAPSRLP